VWASVSSVKFEEPENVIRMSSCRSERDWLGGGTDMHRSGYCQITGPIVVHCIDGEFELLMPGGAGQSAQVGLSTCSAARTTRSAAFAIPRSC